MKEPTQSNNIEERAREMVTGSRPSEPRSRGMFALAPPSEERHRRASHAAASSKDIALAVSVPGKGGRDRARSPDAPAHESIADRASRMATDAGRKMQDWKAGYAELVQQISGFYAGEITPLAAPIRARLGEFLNGLPFDLNNGPGSILQKVQGDYDSLFESAKEYKRDCAEFNKNLERERLVFPSLSEGDIRKTEAKTSASWFLFFAILGLVVLCESAANMALLADALEGGLVTSFLYATLVSVVNVVGIGTGIGFLCCFLYRKLRGVFYAILPLWLGGVVLFNLVVGRDREGKARDVAAQEQAAEIESLSAGLDSLVVASGEIVAASFNPASWYLESMLFSLLGIVLSCFGFYKGLFFIRPGENLKSVLDNLDAWEKRVKQGIGAIASQGGEHLDNLRGEVGHKMQALNDAVGKHKVEFQAMELGWKMIIDVVESQFVSSYNQANPQKKITAQDIHQTGINAPFPAPAAVREIIAEGEKTLEDFEKNKQREFNDKIFSAKEKISQYRGEYRAAIDGVMHG